MAERAAAFTAVADEAKNHASKIYDLGAFDQHFLEADLKTTRDAGRPLSEAAVFSTLPIVVGWTSAEEAARRENIDFRISAFNARNPDNEPTPGSFEDTMLRDLYDATTSGGENAIARVDPETNAMHYMRAIKLTADCMSCHGTPATTNPGGLDMLGYEMEGWRIGDTHGSYHVVMPLDETDAQVAGFIWSGLAWTIPLMAVAVVLLVWLMRRMLSQPIAQLISRIQHIQDSSDLTLQVDVHSDDEVGKLGRCFNAFVTTLREVLTQVSSSTQEVASAATEIAASSEEMAAGVGEQNQQVTQISAAIEQMNSSVVEVARKSADAASNAADSGKVAEDGGRVVSQTVEDIESIRDAVSAGAASVQELGKRGEQIGQIIEVINDIAEQTNLLALNAAIEAARAGEHGRGFAVVADEVRKLADRTTKATEEIGQSIHAIQAETNGAVQRMNTGTERVQQGVERATAAGDSLHRIVTSARDVAAMIQSIAAAAEEQSAASEQVGRNVESIAAVARQTSEGSNQAVSAAAQLSAKAEQLQAMISRFRLDSGDRPHDGGARRSVVHPSRAA
ncbi:MAG: methyl-accepting chemotaxis protein [Phycisphaeraceae bacterium]